MADKHASYPMDSDEVDRAYIDSVTGIADGSFVQGLISVLSWVDPDGTNKWRATWRLDAPVSQGIGLLNMAAMDILKSTQVWDDG